METTFIDYEVGDAIATITLTVRRPPTPRPSSCSTTSTRRGGWRPPTTTCASSCCRPTASTSPPGTTSEAVGRGRRQPPSWTLAGIYETEARRFLEYSLRWRNVPKPSIAAVQGVCIAGGLLLCWPCDLIVAADNAKFSDPVVNMGIGGVEYHGHTWEWGARKAKELLFTGRAMTAEEAERLGMVTRGGARRRPALGDPSAGGRDRDQAPVRAPPGQAGRQPDARRAGLLRRHPVGVRHPPDRSRPRAERVRPPDPDAARRDEGRGRQARPSGGA